MVIVLQKQATSAKKIDPECIATFYFQKKKKIHPTLRPSYPTNFNVAKHFFWSYLFISSVNAKTYYCGLSNNWDVHGTLIWFINFLKLFIFLGCGGKYLGANEVHQYQGVIKLPNLTENHESESYCSWMVELPAGYDITLNFTSFDLYDEALEIR